MYVDREAGWVAFAATMFLVMGIWNIFEGLIAFYHSSFWTSAGAHYVIYGLRTWAWVITIWGIIELLAAASIAKGGQWGRWFGMVTAGLTVILQMAWLPVYPFWAAISIAIHVFIIYVLARFAGKRAVV